MYCNYTLEDAIENMDRATITEMQMRWLLASIRKAADNAEKNIVIKEYDIDKIHMPTLIREILEPSGFEITEIKNDIGQKAIRISW